MSIRDYSSDDFGAVLSVINDSAEAYRGVIPEDCWHDPYMSADELAGEIAAGVQFRVWVEGRAVVGVMGGQAVQDVFLIRHAYVRTLRRRQRIGARLLADMMMRVDRPMLVGTWSAALWAIRFYERHGFQKVTPTEKDRLLRTYWTVPDRQIETSVVLADARWLVREGEGRAAYR